MRCSLRMRWLPMGVRQTCAGAIIEPTVDLGATHGRSSLPPLVHDAWSRHSLSLRARGASAAAWKVIRTAEAVKVVDEVNIQLAIEAHSSNSRNRPRRSGAPALSGADETSYQVPCGTYPMRYY